MTQNNINNCKTALDDIYNFIFNDSSEISEPLFKEKIENIVINKIFPGIFFSLLSGEYIVFDNFDDLLEIIKEKIVTHIEYIGNNLKPDFGDSNNQNNKTIFPLAIETYTFLKEIFAVIDSTLNNLYSENYIELDAFINKRIEFPAIPQCFGSSFDSYLEILRINLFVMSIEYAGLYNIDTLKKLARYYNVLNELYNLNDNDLDGFDKNCISLLKDKVLIIINSLETAYKDKSIKNQLTISEQARQINSFDFDGVQKYDAYSNYLTNKATSKEPCYLDDTVKYGMLKIYSDIYLYNKITPDIKELNKLRSQLQNKLKVIYQGTNKLQKSYWAKLNKHNLQYIDNCVLSLRIKLLGNKSDLPSNYKRDELSNTTDYYNIRRSIDLIRTHVNLSNLVDLSADSVDNYLYDLNILIQKSYQIRNKIKYALTPFYLPINECIISVQKGKKNYSLLLINHLLKWYTPEDINNEIDEAVFVAYETVSLLKGQKVLKSVEEKISTEFSQRSLELENNQNDISNKMSNVQSEIKKSEKRSIEIITLFSAIVMFVAGDIQLLKGVEDMRMAISLILAFGFSLSIFVGLIMLLIGNMESRIQCKDFKSFKYKHAYFIYLILGLIGILYFGFISEDNSIIKFFLYLK